MKKNKLFVPLVILLMGLPLVGCSLPITGTPTPFVFPTPNLTMTAIFSQPVSLPPTVTPAAGQSPTGEPVVIPTQVPQNPTVTPPPQVIFTPVPSATSTSSGTSQPAVSAAYFSTPPTINGIWSDWNTPQLPIGHIVFGASKWKGASDLSAAYRIGWDNTNLYIAVKVNDNVYSQLSSGATLYKGDSLEILFNTDPASASSTQGLVESDYQLGISPGNPTPGNNPQAYLWFPADKAGSQSSVRIAAVAMTGGYRVEAAIPWSIFGVTPASGQQYGFAISVSDDDQPNTAVQEKMISTAANRKLVDPTTWGLLTLSQ